MRTITKANYNPENTRAYFFQNMYLIGLHAGIQSAHTLNEIWLDYSENNHLLEWANEGKTIIVLNGGYSSALLEIESLLESEDNPYPQGSFRESEEALNGAITNVGVILPEYIYLLSKVIKNSFLNNSDKGESLSVEKVINNQYNINYVNEEKEFSIKDTYNEFEINLMKELSSKRLMS